MNPVRDRIRTFSFVLLTANLLLSTGCATRSTAPARPAREVTEKVFADPKAAVEALLGACRAHDENALLAIFGETARPLLSAADPAADHERCVRLVGAAETMTRLDPAGPNALRLVIGADDWPFPVPLVKSSGGWHFDTEAGEAEIRRRWIGADELEAIAICRAFPSVQEAYKDGPGGGAYARTFASTRDAADGLAWPVATDPRTATHGWWGYRFRILTGQGENAAGGALSYLDGERLTGGFALIAYPTHYGLTGIQTFLVARDGRVYEKDFGPQTAELVAAISVYDPDASWRPVP